MNWIDVNERMPKPNQRVLVYCSHGCWIEIDETGNRGMGAEIYLGNYWDETNEWSIVDDYSVLHNVTHWMELPESPIIQDTHGYDIAIKNKQREGSDE